MNKDSLKNYSPNADLIKHYTLQFEIMKNKVHFNISYDTIIISYTSFLYWRTSKK